jgi:hypothetical protein
MAQCFVFWTMLTAYITRDKRSTLLKSPFYSFKNIFNACDSVSRDTVELPNFGMMRAQKGTHISNGRSAWDALAIPPRNSNSRKDRILIDVAALNAVYKLVSVD